MEKPIAVGTVVYSRAGRDEGSYYMIYEIVDSDYVLIVDGDTRRLAKPKKKNIKHLKNTGEVLEGIAKKITESTKIYDAEIFSALRKYNS